jgi:hypothetical protein
VKRDMDLIRAILLEVEKAQYDSPARCIDLDIEGRSREVVSFHVMLLDEAGLIIAGSFKNTHKPVRLTWDGYEFLDAARDEKLWDRAKGLVGQAGAMAFEVLQQVLVKLALQYVQQAMDKAA